MARRVAREEYEHLCWMIKKWNRDRLELFEITMPNENLEFEGIMRFYFQSNTKEMEQKVATKCIRVSNTANTDSVIEALVQKFRPDLRMLTSHSSYALYEVHSNEEERRMESDEYPLMVQLGWVDGEREGRFLLRREAKDGRNRDSYNAPNKRPTKRGKKVKREREGVPDDPDGRGGIARSLYNVMPESKFTRSISKRNERNGRMQVREAAEDTLKVYADSLLPNGPCKSLLISAHDTSSLVVKSSLEKYGITEDPSAFCLVQVVVIQSGRTSENNPKLNTEYSEYVLGDNERPLQWKGGGGGRGETVQFHLRRKDSFSFAQRPHSSSHSHSRSQSPDDVDDLSLPALVEIFLDTHPQQRPRRFLLSADATEIGSSTAFSVGNPDPHGHLCLSSPSIKPRHCVIKFSGQWYTIAALDKSAVIFVNGNPVHGSQVLEHNSVVRLGEYKLFRFFAPIPSPAVAASNGTTSWQNSNHDNYEVSSHGGSDVSRAKSVENIRNPQLPDEIHQNVASSRRLRGKALSEYDLQAQMVGEEDEEGGERRERERKRSDTRTHSELDERHSSPRKRHPSAPQSSFNPSSTSSSNGALLDTERGEWLTPVSLSFHQTKQQLLLKKMVTEVDSHQLHFKLAPAYGLYMMARHMYGAESKAGPGGSSERRKTIVAGLKSISSGIKKAVKDSRGDPGALTFWLANSSELLHFLQQDYQLGPLSNDYDIPFTHTIHLVYKYFVTCMIKELQVFLPAFYDDSTEADREDTPGGYNSGPESVLNRVGGGTEPDLSNPCSKVIRHSSVSGSYYTVGGSKKRGRSTIHDILQTLSSTITILKRCRVNVTLSVMIFSNLFRYVSTKVFNRLVGGEVKHCGRSLGQRLNKRLGKVKSWAEREGMELPAHSHLEMVVEAANLLQASKKYSDNPHTIYATCSNLNSIQVSTLLELCLATDGEATVNRAIMDELIHLAHGRDEILRGEGLEVRVEEDINPELLFHIPGERYSGEVVTGVPSGLQEFLQPMISAGLCKLAVSKDSSGTWCPPVRNVTSSQSMDHSVSSQNADTPHNFNTLPKTSSRSRKPSADSEMRHNTLPRHGDTDLRIMKVCIAKDSNNTLGISIVEAKLTSAHFGGDTGIFIRSMVEGGPAQMDGRLRPGDQILEVDGNELPSCTQDRASQFLRNTGKKVTLMVAKMAAQYYGLSHILQSSPRYKNTPEGSSHAKKAARRLKREQKERQRQERGYTTEFRLERKQLDHHHSELSHLSPTTQQSSTTSSTDPRFANPQIAKWIMEQNLLYNSERGSEAEGPGSNSSTSNIADQETHASSPVPSFTTSSSRRSKSSYERHRVGSPPMRDLSGQPSRLHEGHSVSPFDGLDSLEAQTMSDSASKFSDFSAEPEYSVPPPQSAPPGSRISYKDTFNISSSLCSQQMSNSLTPYGPSQQLDKLSTDVMYHTPQSGASLSGISSIMPRLLHGRGGKPYLGRIHLKELDGDEIDLEKQRIKLMFYEKKNEERSLREEEEIPPQAQDAPSPASSRKVYPASPPPPPPPVSTTAHQFEIPTSLEEDHSNGFTAFSDIEAQPYDPKVLLQDLETLEQMASEQRRRCKELNFAREKVNLDLKKAEVEFQEQELMEPAAGGGMSVSVTHQEKWQKEHKKRLRQLERYRAAQRDRMQNMEAEECHATAKLKAYEQQIYELQQQLEALENQPLPSVASAAIVESHLQSYSHHPSRQNFSRTNSGCSTSFVSGEMQTREDQMFRPITESDQAKPEREWPQQDHPKTNPAQFVSMESINSSSLVGANEIPEFSREIVNTISESTNMTEPTQDDAPIPPGGWGSKYVANSDDPYAGEYASKYTYSDDEFFMDDRRMFKPDVPIDARYRFHVGSEREGQRSPYHHDHQSPRLLNGHAAPGYHNKHELNENGGGVFVERLEGGSEEIRPPHWGGPPQQSKKKHPPPPVSEKPQNHTGGRTNHHYSRSNRPRLHNRNQAHTSDNLSTVSGVSTSSFYVANQDGDSFKSATAALDVVSANSLSPASSKIPSPTSTKSSSEAGHHLTSHHSPGLGPTSPSSFSPFREHPPLPSTTQHVYSVPTSSGTAGPVAVYDVPRKGNGKSVTSSPSLGIYDQPRPSTSSPPYMAPSSPASLPQQSTSSPGPHDPSLHSPFPNPLKSHESRPSYYDSPTHSHEQQHYDVPKPQALKEMFRPPPTLLSSDRDLARQTASNMAAHPYQYHGLPTKPVAPRSYSRGRQDMMGYGADRGVRGQTSRPPQRVQRQQTEL